MHGNDRRWPAAAMAGGLVALAVLMGCGGDQSVASKSAAAFQEAQKKGETFEGSGHSHGHGAVAPGGANPEEGSPGHDHGEPEAAPDHATMDHAAMDHSTMGHGGEPQGAGHASQHGGSAAQPGGGNAGHDMSPQAPAAEGQSSGGGHEGHSPASGMMPDQPAPAADVPSPGQPAKTLSPDPLDAPAATSVADAQRSAEMAEEMSGGGGHGGHGGHGTGTYRQTDAGREPVAEHESHQHGGHGNQDDEEAAAVYVCPMHPEVTSATPGKCPKCGMDLVKRRKG